MSKHSFEPTDLKYVRTLRNNEDDLLEKYLQEISSYTPLSDDEERRLSALALAGDESAKEKLVKANLKFVVSIARQYVAPGVSMLDLINEGNIALIKATTKFDASRGQRFTSYAVWDIRETMERMLRRVSNPSDRVKRPDMDSEPLGDTSQSQKIESFSEQSELVDLIRFLPERERMVIKACFGVATPQMTMAEIAGQYNMSRERVRQVRDRALRRLQSFRKNNKITR